MADRSGCPYLKQEGDQALCTLRGGEPVDPASCDPGTCPHYQASLGAQDAGEPEEGRKKKKEKEKKRGGGGTGCLVALLVASILMFLAVLGLIALAVFFGGALPL